MRVIPAIDLRDGKCVQLIGGSYDRQSITIDEPLEVVDRWNDSGFASLHVVDLDAATGRGSNYGIIESILSSAKQDVQVGGGIRTTEAVREWVDKGADRVIVGTRALEDHEWLEQITSMFPMRIVLAMDVRGRRIATRGWTKSIDRSISAQLAQVAFLPLAGVLVTAVHVEGQMNGPDVDLISEVVGGAMCDVYASGGVTTVDDVIALESAGAATAVVGMALYSGTLDPAQLPGKFKS